MKVKTIQESSELDKLNAERFKLNVLEMSRRQYKEYVLPACDRMGHIFGTNLEEDLQIYVQFTEGDYDAEVPNRWLRLFKALAGPYGKTVLKMYQLNKGNGDD